MYLKLVQDCLAAGKPPSELPSRPRNTFGADFACWRFLAAWMTSGVLAADHAVLLRQVIRWARVPLHLDALPKFAAPENAPDPLATAGLRLSHLGEVSAVPFAPDWLFADEGTTVPVIDDPPVKRRPDEYIPAEPFLAARSSNASWYSQAQKEAAWAVLSAAPRSTTLVALPTGAGKSLCFQLLPLFGSGLTLVVVPTVGLAIDQAEAAREVFTPAVLAAIQPSYYASDDQGQRTLDLVERGQTRLLFTSPEACVSGRLHHLLEEAAEGGRLENLVLDEAHLVATWGMHFRVEFQLLSMLRRRWLGVESARLRTFLFSATFSEQANDILKKSFSEPECEWRRVVSQRLRPEPTYYLRCFDNAATATAASERDTRVLECIWRLPRPAILYATEVDEARGYAALLQRQGFNRTGCFHGETSGTDRRDLIRRWRADELDVMVATSAFGLGVDKQDVRTVIHACLPENIDRYYQEVGRAGRDGGSSVCVLLPTSRDFEVARSLGPKLLKPETVQRRWDAMWTNPREVDPATHVYELCVNARPENLLGARTYSEHVRWNKRLLLQLQRAGELELKGMRYESPDGESDGAEYITVKLAFSPSAGDLAERISAPRKLELEAMQHGLQQMTRYAAPDAECIARMLANVYGRSTTKRVCGGCPACRRARKPALSYCPDLPVDLHSETAPTLTVVTGAPRRNSPGARDDWTITLRRILDRGVRRFMCRSTDRGWVASALDRADVKRRWWYRIDPTDAEGPDFWPDEVIIVLHFGTVDERALELRHGRRVDHLIEDRVPIIDAHGRYPLESSGASLQPFERWSLVH